MNYLDIILAIPLLWFAYKGFTRGIIVEVASLVALIAGIWLAVHFSWYVGEYLEGMLNLRPQQMSMIAFTITFLGVVILVNMVGKLVTALVKSVALGLPNKLAGGAFGFIKTAFIISIVLYLYGMVDPGMKMVPKELKEGSKLFEPVARIAPVVIPRLQREKEKLFRQRSEEEDSE